MTFFDNFTSFQLIAAHRGCRAYYPENTLSAFEACIDKCHFIELDVQLSRDLVPMVTHDPTLERTSNGDEVSRKLGINSLQVKDWQLHQLKQIDVGSWFHTDDPFGTIADQSSPAMDRLGKIEHAREEILTLEEVLQSPSLEQLPINIEIKDHRGWEHDKKVAESVIKVIRKNNAHQRVLISSFNHDYLVITNKCAPEITTAALQDTRHPAALIEYLKSLGVAAYHPSNAITSRDLVRQLRSSGLGVNVYTVNNRSRQKQLFDYGVTAIFTDYPELP